MKTFGRFTCSILALSAVIILTACSSGEFTHKKLVSFCIRHGCAKCDEPEDYFKSASYLIKTDAEGGYFISCTENKAEVLYDRNINIYNKFRSYDVTEVTVFICQKSDSFSRGYLITFDDADDAADFFEEYSGEYCENGEKGINKDYTYSVQHNDLDRGRAAKTGVYLKGNSVLILNAANRNFDIAEDFSKTFNVILPDGE